MYFKQSTHNGQMTQDRGNDPVQGGDPQELKTRLIAQHACNSSQASSTFCCLLPCDQPSPHPTSYTLHYQAVDVLPHPSKLLLNSTFHSIQNPSNVNSSITDHEAYSIPPLLVDESPEGADSPPSVFCYPPFGWCHSDSEGTRATESGNGAQGSSSNGDCDKGGGCTNGSNFDDSSTWDEPDGFEMLWPDDPENANPFTKAAIQGDADVIKEYTKRPTFDPTAKQSQHALLTSCRAGHLEVVKALLEGGVDVHCKDSKSNWQPIHISTYRDDVAIVEALAMHGEWRRGVALVRFKGVTCSLLHLAAHFGCVAVLHYLLSHTVRLGLHIEVRDAAHWTALHHASFEGKLQCLILLLQDGADINCADPHGVTPLHAASYRDHVLVVRHLLSKGANPKMVVRSASSGHERGFERVEPILKFHEGSSLLHWAACKGYEDLVADLLARGLQVDAGDKFGRTPLGLAVWAGHNSIVTMLLHEKVQLAEEDKNWHRITREEEGLTIVRILEETGVATLECCRSDGFNLLHLAAHNGYPNMLHRLLSLKVSPDLTNNQGESPLFVAIRSNQLACVQQLINAGTKLNVYDNRGGTALHMAAKNGNVTVIDMLLTTSEHEERDIDINRTDNIGYTAVYYAINASRYDIVQRFLEYSLVRMLHVKATKNETLLQFYTERNNLGQYDNAVVRVLECEKLLHSSKANAEMCLRVQLGTTESSTKARIQLQQMYESTKAQRHCWNFWFFLSCFLLPSIFYYLDVYTDIILAYEYYQDYEEDLRNRSLASNIHLNSTHYNSSIYGNATISTEFMMETFWEIFVDITDSQHKINFVLTVFFILLPMTLLSMWNLYIHVTQPDILPMFRKLPEVFRGLLYILVFLTPLAPVMAYLENTYAQMKHMNVTARSLQEVESKSCNNFPGYGNTKTYRHHLRDQKIRKYYDLKHVAQMRVAITNVMEATLESAFQLILQLYIVGTQYQDLTKIGEVTLRKILSFSTEGSDHRLSKQVFSVLISLVSLTWSFTSYHRFSKLGGLTILSALPLLFAIFFQVVSRAIACTIFTLSYKWKIFVVLGIHFIIVLMFKLRLEERSQLPPRKYRFCYCILSALRPYFYVFLGTIASTLVYFRLERPSAVKKQLSRRHSTVVIQLLFMVLTFVENFVLLSTGIVGLDEEKYDQTFKIVSVVLCTFSYIIGVVLHGVYYGCFGHPWVDINGPTITRDNDEGTLILAYYHEGCINRWSIHSCCRFSRHSKGPADNVYMPQHLIQMKMNGVHRQVKDI